MLKLALLGIAALLVTSTAAFGEHHGQVVDDLHGWLWGIRAKAVAIPG